jgi:hypothetical protein
MKSNRRKSRSVIRGEERKNRSDVPLEAARLYLEAVAGRCDASALALSTEDGFLLAGTPGDYDLSGIAAVGAACARGESENSAVDEMMDTVARGEDVYASSITIADKPFYLTSVGARVRSVRDATVALSRILSPELRPAGRA